MRHQLSRDEPSSLAYSIQETEGAIESRLSLSAEQLRVLDQMVRSLGDDPLQFQSLPTATGVMVCKDPTQALEVTYRVDVATKTVFIHHYAVPSRPPRTLVISYSHHDRQWVARLRPFLTTFEQDGTIEYWDDSELQAGQLWEESIRRALDRAFVVLLLVSDKYLASKFVTDYGLPRRLADSTWKGRKVLWIPIRPSTVCDSNPEITAFQALTDDPRVSLAELRRPQRDKQLVQVAQRLHRALSS